MCKSDIAKSCKTHGSNSFDIEKKKDLMKEIVKFVIDKKTKYSLTLRIA